MASSEEAPAGQGPSGPEEDAMRDDWHGFVNRARRRAEHHARRALREIGREARPGGRDADEQRLERMERRRQRRERRRNPDLTPEELAYREATRQAEHKIRFVQHLIPYVLVVALLSLVARPMAVLVALGWGIGLASHFFRAFVLPDLRKRWIRSEVEQRVHQTVCRERLQIEGRQLRSLEELSASLAHEIRNPITAAKSLVQQMGEDPQAPENVEYAKVALEELERVERSISYLLRYAREEEMRTEEVHLAEVATDALALLRDRLERAGVEVLRDFDTVGALDGDPEKLRRVVGNLIGNAIDAMEEAKVASPRVEVRVGDNLAGNQVWLRVRDNGPGMDQETQRKIFRPFFTSKANGTGLGLAICKKLVDAHGGAIEIVSGPGQGCEFILTFPKADTGAAARA
jgi:signal transduction histidine kinase